MLFLTDVDHVSFEKVKGARQNNLQSATASLQVVIGLCKRKETTIRQHPINFPTLCITVSSLNESKEHGKRNNSQHQQRPKRADCRGCDIDNAAASPAPHTYHRKNQTQQDKNDIGSGPSGSDSIRQRKVQKRWGKSRQQYDAHNERSDTN